MSLLPRRPGPVLAFCSQVLPLNTPSAYRTSPRDIKTKKERERKTSGNFLFPLLWDFSGLPFLSQGPSSSGAAPLLFPLFAESTRGRQTAKHESNPKLHSMLVWSKNFTKKHHAQQSVKRLTVVKAL